MNFVRKGLRTFINPNDTILDVGCGNKDYSNFGKTTTVDAWEKLSPDHLIDLEQERLPFEENSFDHVLMIDFIEHLDRDKGTIVLNDCMKITRGKIFLLTPLIFNDNSVNVNNANCWAFGNEYDYHKSLWTMEDFKDWTQLTSPPDIFLGYWDKNKLEK